MEKFLSRGMELNGGNGSSEDVADAIPQANLSKQQQSAAKNEEVKQKMEEQRRVILRSILSSSAQERLNRIALVKPQRARGVEDLILQNARMGRIPGKVEDNDLINVLNQVTDTISGPSAPKVTIQRRRCLDDDDDDD